MKCFEQPKPLSVEKRFDLVLQNIVKTKMPISTKILSMQKLILDYNSGLFHPNYITATQRVMGKI